MQVFSVKESSKKICRDIICVGILLVGLMLDLSAQQLPQYTLIQENPYYYNPAAASMNNTLEFFAGYRSQWKDFPGSPKQYLLSGHLPLYTINSSIGFLYESDQLGPEMWNKAGLSMGYVIPTPIGLFSLSGRVFYEGLQFRGSELISVDGNYEGGVIDHRDPLLPNSDLGSSAVSADLGLWLKARAYQIGLSYDGLYHSGFKLSGVGNYYPKGVLVLSGAHKFMMTEEIDINSSIIIKSDFVSLQSQLAISCVYQDLYYFGMELTGYSPSSFEQVGIHAGIKMNKYLSFLYQYGVGLSRMAQVHSGSHEVAILFSLGRPVGSTVLPRIIYNPRYVE